VFVEGVDRRDVVSSINGGDDEREGFNRKIIVSIDKNSSPIAIQNRSVNPHH
jgi:hypothetical protein